MSGACGRRILSNATSCLSVAGSLRQAAGFSAMATGLGFGSHLIKLPQLLQSSEAWCGPLPGPTRCWSMTPQTMQGLSVAH